MKFKTFCAILFLSCAIALQAQDGPLKVGDAAPEIVLPTAAGDSFALSSLRGKWILIDFWATWCAPCVEEQPELKKLYKILQEKAEPGSFEFVGVSLDRNREAWVKAIGRFGISWPQVSDLKFWRSPIAKEYRIEELPFNVLTDPQGRIAAVNLHGKELEDFILRHFAGSKR